MLFAFDHDVFLAIYTFTTSNSAVSDLAVFFAEWFPFLVIGSVVVYEVAAQDKQHEIIPSIIRTLLPALLAWFVVMLVKYMHPAARPFASDLGISQLIDVSDPFGSFPSGHAAAFGALAGAMLGNRFHAWKWYLLAAAVIAISRIAVGVHWPSDVIIGITLGFAAGFLIARPLLMMKPVKKL